MHDVEHRTDGARPMQANSHRGIGWEQFTDAAIRAVDAAGPSDGISALGTSGPDEEKSMLDNPKHLILEAPHPSPLVRVPRVFRQQAISARPMHFWRQTDLTPIDWQIEDV